MLNDFQDWELGAKLQRVFDAASARRLGEGNASSRRQARGERGTREDTFTDNLLNEFEDDIKEGVDAAAEEIADLGRSLNITFQGVNLPVDEEAAYGADIGVKLRAESSGMQIEKAILLQCKKMKPDLKSGAAFPALGKDGLAQARKMLAVTPASFFLLYNYGSQLDLSRLVWPDLAHIPYLSPEVLCASDGACGMTVVPANQVLAATAKGRSIPVDARSVLAGSVPLGLFIRFLLLSCFVGDTRGDVLQLVTPPAERTQALPAAYVAVQPRRLMLIELGEVDGKAS